MKKVTAVLVGAGGRGNEYSTYSLEHPDELQMVAVVEPVKERRELYAKKYGIAPENCFSDYPELFARGKIADCAFICTQDQMHYEPTMMAIDCGYDILLEKPMSPNLDECVAMANHAAEKGVLLSLCYVLRFTEIFQKIKQLLDDGEIGRLIAIQHNENVGFWHMAHSFVRGNWRNKSLSSPMILQKCCHDMDILLWLVGASCTRLTSFGNLMHFKEENAPEDAPAHCLDGCVHRDECPYFAPRFYLEDLEEKGGTFAKVVSLQTDKKSLLDALKDGPYGRCVYHCDNDVVDHQVVNLEFDNGVTASMTMCAFTNKCERIINLMGTKGQIRGNMEENEIIVEDFASGNTTKIKVKVPKGGHSGSDVSMMKDFVELVAGGGTAKSVSAASESIESHLMALAAEDSREHNGVVYEMKGYGK